MATQVGWASGAILGLALTLSATVQGAPSVSVGPMVEVAPAAVPEPTLAGYKAAAFDGEQWLVVYTTSRDHLSGVWIGSDGSPLGTSFALGPSGPAYDPRVVFDGESFVIAWLTDIPDGRRIRLMRFDSENGEGPVYQQPFAPVEAAVTTHALSVDDGGVVRVIGCTFMTAYSCTLSALLGEELVEQQVIPLPFSIQTLELEHDDQGAWLFVDSSGGEVVALHIADDGLVLDEVPLSSPDSFSEPSWLDVVHTSQGYTATWVQDGEVQIVRLNDVADIVSSGSIAFGEDVSLARLASTGSGFSLLALAAEKSCSDCGYPVLLQALSSDAQAVLTSPVQVAESNSDVALASTDTQILTLWSSLNQSQLQSRLLNAAALEGELPEASSLSFTARTQQTVLGAPGATGWLVAWEEVEPPGSAMVVRAQMLDESAHPLGSTFGIGLDDDYCRLWDLSSGPNGWLVAWSHKTELYAALVSPNGSVGSPFHLGGFTGLVRMAHSQAGWLVFWERENSGGHIVVADAFDFEGSHLSSMELAGAVPLSSYFTIDVTATAQGFLLLWRDGFVGLSRLQLGQLGESLGQGTSTVPDLGAYSVSIAVSENASWMWWRGSYGYIYFNALPYQVDTLQIVSAPVASRLRTANNRALAVWHDYPGSGPWSHLGMAEAGGELVKKAGWEGPTVVESLSEPKEEVVAGVTTTRFLVGATEENRIYGGVAPRAFVAIASIEEDNAAGAGGVAGSGDAGAAGASEVSNSGAGGAAGSDSDPDVGESGAAGEGANQPTGGQASEPTTPAGDAGDETAGGVSAANDRSGTSSGCGCRAVGAAPGSHGGAGLVLLLALPIALRRRSARPRTTQRAEINRRAQRAHPPTLPTPPRAMC
jgi:hypothetical protein